MYITKHAKKRLKQRVGLHKKASGRIAEKVLNEGLPHKETTGNLKKWVSNAYLAHCKGNNIRLYGDKAYVFHNDILITVLPIPNELKSSLHQQEEKYKEKLRKKDL